MPSRRYHPITATLAVAMLAGACQGPGYGSSPGSASGSATAAMASASAGSSMTAAPTPSALAVATATAVVVSASPSSEFPASPPTASLAADGGDAVAGQLGTYTWADGGSDSVWLQGAPVSVGPAEPLTVTFRPVVPVSSWRARLVKAGADGPAGAQRIGSGASDVVGFSAPAAGSWTLELTVTFSGENQASYAWLLTSQ